jgi:hypothetical protein
MVRDEMLPIGGSSTFIMIFSLYFVLSKLDSSASAYWSINGTHCLTIIISCKILISTL